MLKTKYIFYNTILKIKIFLSPNINSIVSIIHNISKNNKHSSVWAKKELLVNFNGFKMLLNNNSPQDYDYFKGWIEEVSYEKKVTDTIKSLLKKNDIFIDVGANSGYYSLLASYIVSKRGKVFAFEPVKDTYMRLLKNKKINKFINIFTYNIALGNYNGKIKINISKYSDGQNSIGPIKDSYKQINVNIRKLDTVIKNSDIKKIKLIKIDAEGYELEVLKGSIKLLKFNPKIVFEYNKESVYRNKLDYNLIFEFLTDLGYSKFTQIEFNKPIYTYKGIRGLIANVLAEKV